MIIRRCPNWLLVALCAAVLGTGSHTIYAQNSLPGSILGATGPLDSSQQQVVDTFLDGHIQRLQSDDPAEVAEGRSRITEQFSLSPSQFFIEYYRSALVQRVTPLIQSEQPLMTRLNVAILSAKLSGPELVGILQASANDDSPAVRYWVAKSVGKAAGSGAFNDAQQKDVLTVLDGRLKAENASLVLEQVMLAIAEIQLPGANKIVLEGLDSRVKFHRDNPDARFKPVRNGMQQLWSKLIAERTNGKNVTRDLYELGRIACRYYALVAAQMPDYEAATDDDADAKVLKDDKALMASRCVQVMSYVVKDIAGQTAPRPVNTTSAAELAASLDLWRGNFKASPLNYSDAELSVDP